jgi:WD repeat and SOF domain-containing protein 1
MVPRQREKAEYSQKLIQRYKHLPEVRRIDTKRHVPKVIYQTQKLKRTMKSSAKRKIENKRAHSRPGSVKFEVERRKQLIRESE